MRASAELVRSLGVLAEAPKPGGARLSEMLGLGPLPAKSVHADVFAFNVYPYASVYLDAEGQLGGEARSRIAGFWKAVGIEAAPEPDHLTSLLGLLAGLMERAEAEDDESRRVLVREAAGACLFEHLVPWTSTFTGAVRGHGSEYYARWALMLERTVDALAITFGLGAAGRLPVHLSATDPICTPEAVGGSAFLGQLLAPVRTGMVITRQDLARLGRDVGLGARIGERRYMLEAFLGQDPRGTLAWLAAHARGWVDLGTGAVPSILAFWSERAATTAEILEAASEQAQGS